MSIDFAGDFLVLAATLTQIKSRMLLPCHENEEEEEDPRLEIARPLLEYIQMQSVAQQLASRPLLGEHTFSRHPSREDYLQEGEESYIKVGLFELIDAFQGILRQAAVHHRVDMSRDRLSVKERITQIVEMLEKEGSLTFRDLFSTEIEKGDIVVTFLAVLEMAKMCLVRIAQHSQTGIIRLFYV
jgi:segregation and condensation protein A